MKSCLGIISYLPDNQAIREIRLEKIEKLLFKCNEIFNIPIIIIAQNWGDDENIFQSYQNIIKYSYSKLGISKARIKLREKFLQSDYDYLIMLDDDCELFGSYEDGQKYLKELENRDYAFRTPMSLKLFSISKGIYTQIQMPDISPENNEGYEDIAFSEILVAKFPIKKKEILTHIYERSTSFLDKNSTWANGKNNIDYSLNMKKTKEYIQNILNK